MNVLLFSLIACNFVFFGTDAFSLKGNRLESLYRYPADISQKSNDPVKENLIQPTPNKGFVKQSNDTNSTTATSAENKLSTVSANIGCENALTTTEGTFVGSNKNCTTSTIESKQDSTTLRPERTPATNSNTPLNTTNPPDESAKYMQTGKRGKMGGI